MKNIRFLSIFLLSGIISCQESPRRFNAEKWRDSLGTGEVYVIGNTRYRMALWLEQNDFFRGKNAENIIYTLVGKNQDKCNEIIKHGSVRILLRSHNPHDLIDFFPNPNVYQDTDWYEITFNKNLVAKVIRIHRNPETEEQTEYLICPMK